MNGKVLIVDDESSVLDTCEQLIAQLGMVSESVWVQGEKCIDKILEKLSNESFDCILMDVVMPELVGTQVLDVLEDREITIPVILMSGFSPERLDFYQKRKTVAAILPKPFVVPDLIQSIVFALSPIQRQDSATSVPAPVRQKNSQLQSEIRAD